ncbi:hypothetical protein [Streptomyces violaceus]|uniref:Uncharacterized protein n=1 Tax=Streptomyces violaceus TaxID=1936 RepID=A0ABY9UMH2_STRVL|nr:hypothetical protein [Streptomyces janthinus]WND24089.1 hypothetical protein RI060_42990 [Streptomyces janthinus]GGS96275.1 hypothetical protein GCM10010270_80290 [Streptomyces janthinus]
MQKATIAEGVILLISGALAAGLGAQLADHNVSIAAITATVVFTLTSGMGFANQIGQGLRTSLFTCPTKGCTVSIRARGTSTAELDRLRSLATDHSKHGGAQ